MALISPRRRARSRWAVLGLTVAAVLGALVVSQASATTIPNTFFVVNDQNGANDVPGQVDITRMGRDDTDATQYKIFMSWDATDQWTGTGQTGDACALFDTNGNSGIDFVVCGQIHNPNANPAFVAQTTTSPYAFSCNDKKIDRCGNPSPVSYTFGDQITSGPLGAVSVANRYANLITDTDPFPTGANYHDDSTLEIDMLKHSAGGVLPSGALLVNVCSYPSAGNGGNNNPFDCINTPGGGFIKIVKNTGAVTNSTFSFAISPALASGSTSASIVGTAIPSGGTDAVNDTGALGIQVTTAGSITETQPSSDWVLSNVACVLSDGTTSTGTPDYVNNKITAVTVQSGQVTTCTFTDRTQPKLTLKKVVTNNNGGTTHADAWTLTATPSSGTTISGTGTLDTTTTADDALFGPTTAVASVQYTLSESSITGYSQVGDWSCTAGSFVSPNKITLALGQSATCTVTNDDNAPGLTLIKNVKNDNGGTNVATDWTFSAAGTTGGFSNQTLSSITTEAGFNSSASTGSQTVTAGVTYTLSESNTPTGYTAGTWACTGTGGTQGTGANTNQITLALGASVTCRLTNDDTKASPSGSTAQSYTLFDSLTMSSLRTGAGTPGTLTFKLWSTNTAGSCSNQVGAATGVVVSNITANTKYSMATGISVTDAGTYYWTVTYSGDQYNNGFTTTCGSEYTTISKHE